MKNIKNPTQTQRTTFQYPPEQNPGEKNHIDTKQKNQSGKHGRSYTPKYIAGKRESFLKMVIV